MKRFFYFSFLLSSICHGQTPVVQEMYVPIKLFYPSDNKIDWADPEGIAFDDNYIYFRDIEIATIGVLNRQTKQIEWYYRLYDTIPRTNVVINDIQVSDNKLYVLDTGGTLHIFEREI